MLTFEVKNTKFKLIGTRFFEYTCENQTKQIWYADIKNLETNKIKTNIHYDKIEKYL